LAKASIEDIAKESSDNFEVFPNPSNGKFNFSFKGLNDEKIEQILLSDLNGESIQKFSAIDNVIQMQSKQNGVYVLIVKLSSGKTISQKLVLIND
jgi:hypothetical protein